MEATEKIRDEIARVEQFFTEYPYPHPIDGAYVRGLEFALRVLED